MQAAVSRGMFFAGLITNDHGRSGRMNKRQQIEDLLQPFASQPQQGAPVVRGTNSQPRGLLDYYLGPTGIPERLRAANDMLNPVVGMMDASQAAQRAFAPDASPWARFAAVGDMLSNVAGVAAPMAGAGIASRMAQRAGGSLADDAGRAANAVVESMTGMGAAGKQAAGDFAMDQSGAVGRAMDESPAQMVARMLREGRADEVTDDMMARVDPQEMYRLYDSGATGAAMPMDEASRMARAQEMGFDTGTPLYRGDRDLPTYGTGAPGPREGIGVTSSSSPNIAATYLPNDGTIAPLVSRAQNRLELDAGGRSWTGIPADARTNRGALNDTLTPSSYLDDDNLFDFNNGVVADWGDGTSTGVAIADTNSVSRAAQGQGFDEVRFSNIRDRGGSGEWHTGLANDPHTTVMTADPRNIRSRFARFDPRLRHLANLSAAGAGAAVLSNGQEDERRRLRDPRQQQ